MSNHKQIRAVIFDWGDTLMRDLTEYSGPMVDWPRVEVIDGVHAALAALVGSYTLAVATNAAESGVTRVRAALRRVDLDDYFEAVFTARELGARKPDRAFFHAVVTGLGCAPAEALMVGDHYGGDVHGAKAAGLNALWYNPSGGACAGNMRAVADAELLRMQDLPAVLAARWLPDVETCTRWLNEQGASARLLAHVRGVAGVAYELAVGLRGEGEPVDPWLAHRGGLLHDLDKITCAAAGFIHGEQSHAILSARGEPELAEIARRHLLGGILDPGKQPLTWEQKLVYYADKLVEQDQVVSLGERFAALLERYPGYAAEMRRSLPKVLDIEADICRIIGMQPSDLTLWLRDRLTGYSSTFS